MWCFLNFLAFKNSNAKATLDTHHWPSAGCWLSSLFSLSLSLSFCTFMGRDQFNKYDKNKQGQFSNLRGTFDHLQTSGVLLLNHSGTICLLTLDRSMMWISLNLNWRPFFLSEFMNYLRFFILYFCDYVYTVYM